MSNISAPIGIQTTRSRLDLAGVDIVAGQQALCSQIEDARDHVGQSPHPQSTLRGLRSRRIFSLRDTSLEENAGDAAAIKLKQAWAIRLGVFLIVNSTDKSKIPARNAPVVRGV